MASFLLDISTSAYYVLGVMTVALAVLGFIIYPLIKHIQNMDNIVEKKLSLLPTSTVYEELFNTLKSVNKNNESISEEFQKIKEDVDLLTKELKILNKTELINDMSDIFLEDRENLIGRFSKEVNIIDNDIKKFIEHFRYSFESSTRVQMDNLVLSKIVHTKVLIKLVTEMISCGLIGEVDLNPLKTLISNLEDGFDSVNTEPLKNVIHVSGGYKLLSSNFRSGNMSRLHDEKYND